MAGPPVSFWFVCPPQTRYELRQQITFFSKAIPCALSHSPVLSTPDTGCSLALRPAYIAILRAIDRRAHAYFGSIYYPERFAQETKHGEVFI